MFKSIETWPQKKLKWIYRGTFTLYTLLSFIAPIIVVLVMASKVSETKYKIPVLCIVIMVIILISLAKLFTKSVDKIKIFNIDGTYNRTAQNLKHILQFVSHSIIPISLLIATILFNTIFSEWIHFYSTLIIWCLSFYIAGDIIDKLFLSELDEELSIRDEVAKDNAKSRRTSLS